MPQEEKTHKRWPTYSAWHRRESIARFFPGQPEIADTLVSIDIDVPLYIEWGEGEKRCVALLEVAMDQGKGKSVTILRDLARRARLPAYAVLYTPTQEANPADSRAPDVASFRVRRIYPEEESEFRFYWPEEYAQFLWKLRKEEVKKMQKEQRTG